MFQFLSLRSTQIRIIKSSVMSIALGATLFVPATATAAAISENLSFTLTGFVDISPNSNIAPPIPMITGAITVNYDPSLSYDNDTTDIVVHSLTGITVDSPLGFTYQNGFLEFGGTQNDSDFIYGNTNDLVVSFNVTDPSNPTFIPCSTPGYTCGQYTGSDQVDAAGYALTGYSTGWFYGVKSTVSPTLPPPPPPPTSATPEPSSVALLGFGIAGMGVLARRRKS